MRPQVKASLALLGAGLLVAALRIGAASAWLRGPGVEALSDLAGCVLAAGSLFGVLAIRSLAADAERSKVIDDGLTSLAAGAWLVASLPPRASNYVATGATDDFVTAYAPASLVAVALLLLSSSLVSARTERALVVRHALLMAVVVPLTGALVWRSASGPGFAEHAQQGLIAGAVWLGAALVAWVALKPRAQAAGGSSTGPSPDALE